MQATVVRGLFSYELQIRTNRAVQQNSDLLQRHLAEQKRPKGFVVQDPRLDGTLFGATFTLYQHDAMWWGITPQVEGSFIPTSRGSDILVNIDWPKSAVWMMAIQGVAVFLSLTVATGLSVSSTLIALAIGAIFTAFFANVKTVFHGEHAARIVTAIFC